MRARLYYRVQYRARTLERSCIYTTCDARTRVRVSAGVWPPAHPAKGQTIVFRGLSGPRQAGARHRSGDERLVPSRDRKGADICGRVKALQRRTAPWPRPARRLCTEEHALHPRPSIANACSHAAPGVSDRVRRLPAGSARGWRTLCTTACTWLDLTCAASRFQPRYPQCPRIAASTAARPASSST